MQKQWTVRDEEMTQFYSQFISDRSLCFDVGANIGNRVKVFLRLNADVVALEPQSKCVKILREIFRDNPHLTILQLALGEKEGEAEIMISDSDTISSISQDWIEAVRKSGRFSEYHWDKKEIVKMTTLDWLIDKHGMPDFIKIDVEGYELQVIKGLSKPVRLISFEFTPEYIDSALKCIDHLDEIGDIHLNYSVGETMQLALETWIEPPKMKKILSGFVGDNKLFGDVYVRFNT